MSKHFTCMTYFPGLIPKKRILSKGKQIYPYKMYNAGLYLEYKPKIGKEIKKNPTNRTKTLCAYEHSIANDF